MSFRTWNKLLLSFLALKVSIDKSAVILMMCLYITWYLFFVTFNIFSLFCLCKVLSWPFPALCFNASCMWISFCFCNSGEFFVMALFKMISMIVEQDYTPSVPSFSTESAAYRVLCKFWNSLRTFLLLFLFGSSRSSNLSSDLWYFPWSPLLERLSAELLYLTCCCFYFKQLRLVFLHISVCLLNFSFISHLPSSFPSAVCIIIGSFFLLSLIWKYS